MSRGAGFPTADVDPSKHSDPKMRALWRLLRDEAAMNAAVVLHDAVILASWRDGERVSAENAAPFWMDDVDTPATALAAVGLLDDKHHLPLRSWRSWFVEAQQRRDDKREVDRLRKQRERAKRSAELAENASETPFPTEQVYNVISEEQPETSTDVTRDSERVLPSYPTYPSYPTQPSHPSGPSPSNGRPHRTASSTLPTVSDDDRASLEVREGRWVPKP